MTSVNIVEVPLNWCLSRPCVVLRFLIPTAILTSVCDMPLVLFSLM